MPTSSSSSTLSTINVEEPFPIFTLAHKYLIYDVNTITHVRQRYNITGVLIGGLPQAPQQNVFLGIPVELMPEEARVLVEKGVSYIVDDVKRHKNSFLARPGAGGLSAEERRQFQLALRRQGQAAAREVGRQSGERKKKALKEKLGAENWNDVPEEMLQPKNGRLKKGGAKAATLEAENERENVKPSVPAEDEDEILFASPMNSFPVYEKRARASSNASTVGPDSYAITPTTSYPPLTTHPPPPDDALPLPEVPRSYPLYKHMHAQGYFLSPGLRFDCQYVAYPGDPLRFHSHFLCNGLDWDQAFDLQDLVGGGRLGTGVKKGFLLGGEAPPGGGSIGGNNDRGGKVRTFCIEWGGM